MSTDVVHRHFPLDSSMNGADTNMDLHSSNLDDATKMNNYY